MSSWVLLHSNIALTKILHFSPPFNCEKDEITVFSPTIA
jgi:hypothetical protein